MGDIINVFNEVWIKKIYDGELLNVSNFSAIFSSPFFEQICNKLDGDELVIHEQFRMNINTFIGLFLIFAESKNKGISLSFDDILREYLKEDYEERKIYYDDYYRMVILFESIYKKLNINEEDDLDINRTKIYRFLKLLIKNALMKEKLDDSLYYDGMEDPILNKIHFENFVFDVDSVLTKKRGCEIIHKEYGLDCTPKDRRAISIDSKISTERVKIEERRALWALKRSSVMQKYK